MKKPTIGEHLALPCKESAEKPCVISVKDLRELSKLLVLEETQYEPRTTSSGNNFFFKPRSREEWLTRPLKTKIRKQSCGNESNVGSETWFLIFEASVGTDLNYPLTIKRIRVFGPNFRETDPSVWCFGASYTTHIVAPCTPNFHSLLCDKNPKQAR